MAGQEEMVVDAALPSKYVAIEMSGDSLLFLG